MPSPSHPLKKAKILSIDPGFKYFGFAILDDSEVLSAGLSKTKVGAWATKSRQPPSFLALLDVVQAYEWESRHAVIEFPRVHRDTPNNDSIVKLAAACGAYTALLETQDFTIEWVEPREWKGMVPKDIMYKRIIAKLNTEEYSRIDKPQDHNVIDAVGIGLWQIRKTRPNNS